MVAPTPVTALHEKLHIDCTRGETCSFVATYDIENPEASTLEVLGQFFAYGPTGVDVALDGQDVHAEIAAGETAALLQRARAVSVGAGARPETLGAVQGFRFRLEGKRRAVLTFKGELRSVHRSIDDLNQGYVIAGPAQRHPFVFNTERGMRRRFAYALGPIRTWGGKPRVDVEIVAPADRDLEADSAWSQFARSDRSGNTRRIRATIEADQASDLAFEVNEPRRDSILAGPVLGIGGRLDTKEFRLRAGVELTGPAKWAIYSLNFDSNLKDYLVASAVIEASTPAMFFVLPALAVGAGLPVRFEKGVSTRVGVRGQLAMTLPFIGLVFPIDYYPATSPRGDHFDLSLLGRVSF